MITTFELLKSSVYMGHQHTRWNTRMYEYMLYKMNKTYIINTWYTMWILKKGMRLIKEVIEEEGRVKIIVERKQKDGLLENKLIKKDNMLKKIDISETDEIKPGMLSNREHKERMKVPEVMFVQNEIKNKELLCEGERVKIPVITIISTASTPDKISYGIPGNSNTEDALNLYGRVLERVLEMGIKGRGMKYKKQYKIYEILKRK